MSIINGQKVPTQRSHEISESRLEPLLLTGSYVGWMRDTNSASPTDC